MDSKFIILNSAPRAYSEGKANFYGYDFLVNQHTLIPRPETEQLVERTLGLAHLHLPGGGAIRILDVGTGSGVIAITLKKLLPNAVVEATDISPQALLVARQNARANLTEVIFHQGNLLESAKGRFDLIITNLPYVPAGRWRFLDRKVRDFEPRSAIIAGRDGLKWIRQFCQQIGVYTKQNMLGKSLTSDYLNAPSIVALEIDDTHGPRVLQLLQDALPNHLVKIESDLAHKVRFAFAVPRGRELRI